MDLIRQPFGTLFDRMFSDWLSPFNADLGRMPGWDFNVDENDNEIVIRADAPGFDENDLNIHLENNALVIRAEKQQQGDGGQEYRSLYETVMLPNGVDPQKVQATYRNGVLEIHVPRPEESRRRRIQIQGQGQSGGQISATGQQGGSSSAGQQATGNTGQTGTSGQSGKGRTRRPVRVRPAPAPRRKRPPGAGSNVCFGVTPL